MKRMSMMAAVLALCVTAGFAGNYELGVIVGEPTGISAKKNLEGNKALAAAAAWSFSGDGSLSLHVDHLWFRNDVIKVEKGRLPLYYGIGGRLRLENRENLGVRFPVGLQYFFQSESLTVFLELVPILDVAPDTDFDLAAAVGFRILL
ncbi:MAG: hypothetical protein HY550_06595 [Elusimicrobia bacterium]|nr:hypothetical protein [Elusimicrobiota bacterium]